MHLYFLYFIFLKIKTRNDFGSSFVQGLTFVSDIIAHRPLGLLFYRFFNSFIFHQFLDDIILSLGTKRQSVFGAHDH